MTPSHIRRALITGFLILICGAAFGSGSHNTNPRRADVLTQMKQEFLNPRPEYRVLPMDVLCDKSEECEKWLSEGGWGGAHTNYPLGGAAYLHDPAGWDRFRGVLDACKRKGLPLWIYDEAGYPSGRAGGQVLKDHPEYEAQGLFYDHTDISAKAAKPVEWQVPEGAPFYVALAQTGWRGQVDYAGIKDITDRVKDGKVHIEIPEGTWRIMAFVANRLREGTHAVLTGGPYLNVMDPDAVKRFIETTYDAYYSRFGADFGTTIQAFFNDEASLMGGYLTEEAQKHPALSWYQGLPNLFKQRNGYDIKQALPALFNDAGDDTIRLRSDFYSTVSEAVADAYFGQIEKWCKAHKVAFTGHLLWEESLLYHASFYGSIFPSLAKMDWPGIDVLGCGYGCTSGARTEGGPVTPKLIGSAAHLYDKKRTISESFCFVKKDTPVENLLAHVNWQWVLGINTLTTLSIQNEYQADVFRTLNEYTGRLSYMLTQGRFAADVAVLYPIASVWAEFVPTNRHVSYLEDHPRAKDVDDGWQSASRALLANRRDFDYVDEPTLEHARVDKGAIEIGQNRYSILVLPHVTTLRYPVLKRIAEFVEKGGTVISFEALPKNREDAGSVDEFRQLVSDLWDGNTKRKGRVVHAETLYALSQALSSCGQPDVQASPDTRDLYYQHRVLDNGDIYFLVNNAETPMVRKITFRATGDVEVWDPRTGEMKPTKASVKNRTSTIDLTLPARGALFVVLTRP